MTAPKQPDLGGEAAWKGGNSSIDKSGVKGILHCFVLRRLQSLATVTSQPDPTKLVTMSFEAMLLAIETLLPILPCTLTTWPSGAFTQSIAGPSHRSRIKEWKTGRLLWLASLLCSSSVIP